MWTYAVGTSEIYGKVCPCAGVPGSIPPSFVGEHYYCESGNTGPYKDTIHTHYGMVPALYNNCTNVGSSESFLLLKMTTLKLGSVLVKITTMKLSLLIN